MKCAYAMKRSLYKIALFNTIEGHWVLLLVMYPQYGYKGKSNQPDHAHFKQFFNHPDYNEYIFRRLVFP